MTVLVKRKFPPPVERETVARDWEARGFDCRWFIDPPGTEWNDFVHPTNELVTVVEGVLSCTLAGEAMRVEPGDELTIPRRQVHCVKNVHSGTTRWLFGYDGG